MPKVSSRLLRLATAAIATASLSGFGPFSQTAVPNACAQTSTTGSVSGTVTDPSGAVIPGATVTLSDRQGGTSVQAKSNEQGRFSFPLLRPSTYTVRVEASGMAPTEQKVPVQVGESPEVTLAVAPASANQAVTVSAQSVPLTDTESPSIITTFTEQQVQNLPAPGGDITTVAFTAPGAVPSTGSGYGNFSVDGLPGISNLYVINGFDEEDPFLNLNNSGSSNLTLGQAEIAEASVVVNGYSSQYGRQAGAITEYTTKSGSDQFHGQANYHYNGDALNANDWFRNNAGVGRERQVSNEWAANVGGPIIKNKVFFFTDYEGLRYVLPAAGQAVFPSQQLQAYTLAHVSAASLPFYQQAFSLYNGSPNSKNAVPVSTGNNPLQDSTGNLGCGPSPTSPTTQNPNPLPVLTQTQISPGQYFGSVPAGASGVAVPCETAAEGNASNTNKEYLYTARVDWNISDKQRLFGRFKLDHGTQPTSTSFVSPFFNETSSQPSYEGQLNDSITLTPHLTNQFIFAANWYTAFFGPSNQAQTLAAFPTYLTFNTGSINTGANFGALGENNAFPQGRNVSQYQFVDDLSWVRGNHTMSYGFDFRREDLSDYDAQAGENGVFTFNNLLDFVNGSITSGITTYTQTFATQKTAYLALYNLGAYLQDQWQVSHRLHLTYGVRFDRNGNGLCNNNCFASYNGSFPQSGASLNTPYNQSVIANRAHAFNNVEAVEAQGRAGFNYSLTNDGHTVLRGGIGLFSDTPPSIYLDSFTQNFPQLYSATVTTGQVGPAASPQSASYFAAQSNTAIQAGFNSGQSATQIANTLNTLNVPFTAPNFYVGPVNFRFPKYLEFNLQIQKQFTTSDAITIGYVGNVGYDEFIENLKVNGASALNFGGLPTVSPDPRFQQVSQIINSANSNYNGLQITYRHVDRHGLSVDLNYTFSHALDDVSNGGLPSEPYNNAVTTVTSALSPYSLSALNYSNADTDVRQIVSADYLYQLPYITRYGKLVNSVAGGWLFGGKTFWHTGSPFSVINSGLPAEAGVSTLGGQILASPLPGTKLNYHCNGGGASAPCFTAAQFETSSTQTNFGTLRRNSFFGPRYADSDFALSKKFVNTERANLQIGTYAFNVFNHPNFQLPGNDVAGNPGLPGSITPPPTSPYGSFSGAGIGGRVLQVFGKVTF